MKLNQMTTNASETTPLELKPYTLAVGEIQTSSLKEFFTDTNLPARFGTGTPTDPFIFDQFVSNVPSGLVTYTAEAGIVINVAVGTDEGSDMNIEKLNKIVFRKLTGEDGEKLSTLTDWQTRFDDIGDGAVADDQLTLSPSSDNLSRVIPVKPGKAFSDFMSYEVQFNFSWPNTQTFVGKIDPVVKITSQG